MLARSLLRGGRACVWSVRALTIVVALATSASASAQRVVSPEELAALRASAKAGASEWAEVAPVRARVPYWGIARLASHVPPGAGRGDAEVDLYTGLQTSGNGFWSYGEAIYWALDDGTMGGGAAAVGGGHVTKYQFSFGLHADLPGVQIQPLVVVSFYNAPADPVGHASNPVVEPPAPVSSVSWLLDPITLSTAGEHAIQSELIDLSAEGVPTFDLGDTYYVEILPLEWDAQSKSGVPNPDVHAVFTGPGSVSYGTNQDKMWSDVFVYNPGLTAGNGDGLYQHPDELDTGGRSPSLDQSGIRLIGVECPNVYALTLGINEPDDICVKPGEQVTVTLSQSCLPGAVRGYQAFLKFDQSRLTFDSGAYIAPTVYGLPIITPIAAVGGEIDVAAGINDSAGQLPTSASAGLVRLTFTAGSNEGPTNVAFRTHDPPTRFSDPTGQAVVPWTDDSPTICVDATPPSITCPADLNLQCVADVPAAAANYTEFVAQGGTAADSGCYSAVTVTHEGDSATGTGCPLDPYVVLRTYRATDCAGNYAECTQKITVADDTDPTGTAPTPVTVACDDVLPVAAANYAEFVAQGGTADDNCTPQASLVITHVDGVLVGGVCGGTVDRTYTIADSCGNSIDVVQVITVNDDVDPTGAAPTAVTVACDDVLPVAAANYAELVAQGGTADDNCTPQASLVVTHVDGVLVGGVCGGTVDRTYTIADSCGNSIDVVQVITVNDDVDPDITCPGGITTNADAGGCTAVVDPGTATATDNCDPSPVVTATRSDGKLLNDPYPAGTTTITWRATDACGNFSECPQTVTVNAANDLVVAVQLSPTMAVGPFTRCITFELWECAGPSSVVVEQELTFTNGSASATIDVPCGSYECITARDRLHTLRRTDETFGIVGSQYVADFTGDPATGGDWLHGGNLNDDNWIDILDFGTYSFQYVTNPTPGANTTCTTPAPHADINGDGIVTSGDFTFIQIKFLKASEANCCGLLDQGDGPLAEISVAELRKRGLGHLAAADLNGDGRVDARDMAAFMNGARPRPLPEPAETSPEDAKKRRQPKPANPASEGARR